MDWNITDSHILEFTAFSDKRRTNSDVYANIPGCRRAPEPGRHRLPDQGGDNYILKYTGYLTETFTLSALAGHGEFAREPAPAHGQPACRCNTPATSTAPPRVAR